MANTKFVLYHWLLLATVCRAGGSTRNTIRRDGDEHQKTAALRPHDGDVALYNDTGASFLDRDGSLMIFDKKRHFEVSPMDAQEYEEGNSEENVETLNKIRNKQRRKNGSRKNGNKKRNSDRELRNSDREKLKAVEGNGTITPTRIREGGGGKKSGTSLRELAARRNLDIKQKMLNDHHDASSSTDDSGTNRGELINSFNGGYQDPSKLSYATKIRQLNTKLNEAFSGSSPVHFDPVIAAEMLGISCDFEKTCVWKWNTSTSATPGFEVVTAEDTIRYNAHGNISTDADGNEKGHFLYLPVGTSTGVMAISSPKYYGIFDNCKLEVSIHQHNMQNASIKVITEQFDGNYNNNNTVVVVSEVQGQYEENWLKHLVNVGPSQQDIQIVLEIVPGSTKAPAHIALDNVRMVECFPEMARADHCNSRQIKCLSNNIPVCINSSRVCDIVIDCDQGEDERQDCDKTPIGSRCTFEDGWCGWKNAPTTRAKLMWSIHSGPTPTENTGPETDHTCYKRNFYSLLYANYSLDDNITHSSCKGQYLYVNMAQHGNDNVVGFASNANLDSVIFNPPPKVHGDANSKYYNSCMIRFYYHQFGKNSGSISLVIVELKEKENTTNLLWWSAKNMGNTWVRAAVILPNITTRYYLQFETRRGMRIYSDVAIDDFSMAPECFGINIPPADLGDYNYWDPIHLRGSAVSHQDFENKTYYELSTCGSVGRFGPHQEQCNLTYKNTSTHVHVMNQDPFKGIQAWTVPFDGLYTVIAYGAGGGLGSGGTGSTRGASVRALLDLHKGQILYTLVGQQGVSACIKTLSVLTESNCKQSIENANNSETALYHSKTHQIKNTVIQDGGGGGGGGTFLFLMSNKKSITPLLAAGGGGGLGAGRPAGGGYHHGKGLPPPNIRPRTGHMYGPPDSTPGAGGGWLTASGLVTPGHEEVRGEAITAGGRGGRACSSNVSSSPGSGGFGGGGGGCSRGGAGGGWAGGDSSQNSSTGEGGYSFIDYRQVVNGFTEISPAVHSGSGVVIIIPAIQGCGCDYRCIALDEYRSKTRCICPEGWITTGLNKTTCELPDEYGVPKKYITLFLGAICVCLLSALTGVCFMLYSRYQVRKKRGRRQKALLEQDISLNRLRSTVDESALTSFNPNYGCDAVLAGGFDVRTLPQVPRESLKLVKALGQGAFGEVYQGFYKHRDGDTIEMPVAVKTLPELSTGQSETDFLMEAAIMAKFNHPNIVHLIGVCFDSHPRFIVLELLAGGDLKNFLRENRPRPERSSSLGMKDLILCALDVSKGCKYMETKRFIHRDIAARNCLLSSKGPGRVVKIADFGMARDIYRADYYRKGGKAMLPIKWMPPEAFLDGIFTSRTDVWSFGVLLWEVFSLGIMPYTGCANREVMQLVTGGGRLDIPHGCPPDIYRLMSDCWNPSPDLRPTFSQLFERLTHFTQDPDLMQEPLPTFIRSNSSCKDFDSNSGSQNGQQTCGMLVNQASDYLVPLLPLHRNQDSNCTTNEGATCSTSISNDVHLSGSSNMFSTIPIRENNPSSSVNSPPTSSSHTQSRIKLIHPPEYGNIALTSRLHESNMITESGNGSHSHSGKFQPSKSTDRLLASMEGARDRSEDSDNDDEDGPVMGNCKEWETSFTETATKRSQPINSGPVVDKLISIDTPQQTPTSLQPPENTLSKTMQSTETNKLENPKKIQTPEAVRHSPKTPVLTNVSFVKQKPLCLDAAQLEQNLNALKKKSGSVNLNNMNILPPYVNVLTPSKLSKSESRKIQIDPKKAIIHDLASPPPVTENNIEEREIPQENQLKPSNSTNSLLNGPLTDLPYADSDNASSSSSNGGANIIGKLKTSSKQNHYTEIVIHEDESKKPVKKQNKSGGFLNNDSEISC